MNTRLAFLLIALLALPTATARAHFLWLVKTNDAKGGARLQVYFGEGAEPDDPALLARVKAAKVWRIGESGKPLPLPLKLTEDSLSAGLDGAASNDVYLLQHTYGIFERGGDAFLLKYYGATGPNLDHWPQRAAKGVDFQLTPAATSAGVQVKAVWRGKPLSKAQVVATGPGLEFEAETDENGVVTLPVKKQGVFSIRGRHIEKQAGKHDGKAYSAVRHYTTLVLNTKTQDAEYPALPELVTSFGAAVAGDALYVYGGHTGAAHAYSNEAQAHTLRRLDLKSSKGWESLNKGPRLQGLAMVAHKGKLYRIGGFTAKNKEGEDHDLHSQAGVARFDPAKGKWAELPPLPEPRSSFDAAVLGDTIYVIGGWSMQGDADSQWHKTAYALDLSKKKLKWKALPAPPFQRRALSVAAHQGKIYAIGGMQQKGGPTTRVDVFDPATKKWSKGPSLQGKGMDGFGSSSFATGGQLYVTTYSGHLQRLSKDGAKFEIIRELDRARFFHRMLPLSDNQLISVGGASMQIGKFEEVDVISVD